MADVARARDRIAGLVDPSPVIRSPGLSDRLGVPVWLKLECLQPPGSFKVRGAASKMLALRAMVASLQAGHPVDIPDLPTLAEVLGGGIGLDNRWSMAAVRQFVGEHVLVSEDEIAAAMTFCLAVHRVLAEGGGAVALGAALAGKLPRPGGPLAIVVSGGNVDPAAVVALAGHRSGA